MSITTVYIILFLLHVSAFLESHYEPIPNTQRQALLSLLPTKLYMGDQIKNMMERACGAYGTQERHVPEKRMPAGRTRHRW